MNTKGLTLKEIVFFDTSNVDYFYAHLFEHCFAEYLLTKLKTRMTAGSLPRGLFFSLQEHIFDNLPDVVNLQPYANLQKKRIYLEYLNYLDRRENITGLMYELKCTTYEDLNLKIESYLNIDDKKVDKIFQMIFERGYRVLDLNSKLPSIENDEEITLSSEIKIPNLNTKLDVVELSFKLSISLESKSYITLFNKLVDESILKIVAKLPVYNIHPHLKILKNSFCQIYAIKVLRGDGIAASDALLNEFRKLEFSEEAVQKHKAKMQEYYRNLWKQNIVDPTMPLEYLCWRRVLKPEDYDKLDIKKIVNTHTEMTKLIDY